MMEGAFSPGTVLLDKYRIESVLGRGGMGVVLRVMHLHVGEELAMKILSPDIIGDPDAHARFLREAQSAIRLRGEHVTRVGDVGMLPQGAPYIVMEYLRGVDLSGQLKKRGTLPPGEIVDHVLQACEALAEAHTLGIVHRDIKPSNLFLTSRPDGTPLVKVLDFGISKVPVGGGLLTRTDTVMGTPGYMSPEQMKASKDVGQGHASSHELARGHERSLQLLASPDGGEARAWGRPPEWSFAESASRHDGNRALHAPQNRYANGFATPHVGHGFVAAGAAIGSGEGCGGAGAIGTWPTGDVPHAAQCQSNTSSGLPQCGHAIVTFMRSSPAHAGTSSPSPSDRA